jgi:hypothetical protein
MTLQYKGLVDKKHPKQSFAIYNGKGKLLKRCDFDLNSGSTKTVTLNIVKNQEQDAEGNIVFVIQSPDSISPKALTSLSGDTRLLGMRLYNIKVIAVNN